MTELIACEYKGCINDLSKWEKEELYSRALEIRCPECGALHELFRSSNDILYIKLIEDNG